MRYFYLFLLGIVCFFGVRAQEGQQVAYLDAALIKKISIGPFCLCQTKVTDLRRVDKDLKAVDVEEMDLCTDGFTKDARFVKGKGFYSEKLRGMIFQQDEGSDFISKIRLTKDFAGKLPDGTPIVLKDLLAKDVLKLYPNLTKKWMSRGCSDYWKLSDDTLSFYVKIDKGRSPQYPVDEAYYAEKPIEGIDLVVSCPRILETRKVHQMGVDPLFFLDSVSITRSELGKIQAADIAFVNVYKDSNAIQLVGPQGKYGVVYLQTKVFTRRRYWNFFSSRSPEYRKAVPAPEADSAVVYILNDKVLKENADASLAPLDEQSFTGLKVIDRNGLMKTYGISGKPIGVVIKARGKN